VAPCVTKIGYSTVRMPPFLKLYPDDIICCISLTDKHIVPRHFLRIMLFTHIRTHVIVMSELMKNEVYETT
jgi:hypothetical protein